MLRGGQDGALRQPSLRVVLPRNLASPGYREAFEGSVLLALGMRQEAHFIENIFLKGEWCDSLIFALLDREFRARV